MFCQKKVASGKLPPTHGLLNHLKRANYQTYIWKNAKNPVLNMPSPVGNGWKLDKDGLITQHLMNEPSALAATVEFTFCKCQKECRNKACSRRGSDLQCTDACPCLNVGCENCEDSNGSTTNDDNESDSDWTWTCWVWLNLTIVNLHCV